ncbi:MAG: hypothetical protein ABL952_06820 [Pyrinomonadaceae bacterium]
MTIHILSFTARLRADMMITRSIVSLAFMLCAGMCVAQTTAFTFQGRLTEASMPATGTYDFQFALYDAGGTLINPPAPIVRTGVAVTNGAFVAQLDFGTAGFPSADRYLEIRVTRPADPSYTALTPRQRITTTPYAIRANTSTFSEFATFASSAGNAQTATTANTATTADNVTGVVAIANGGTGSSTKNFVDTGNVDQFVGGVKTFNNIGGNGANLTGVVQPLSFSGSFPSITIPNTWTWVGNIVAVQVNTGQRLTVSGSIDVSVSSLEAGYQFTICRQTPAGPITPFHSGIMGFNGQLQPIHRSYHYSGLPGANTYFIGVCGISTESTNPPVAFGFVTGWAMVTK